MKATINTLRNLNQQLVDHGIDINFHEFAQLNGKWGASDNRGAPYRQWGRWIGQSKFIMEKNDP